MLEVRDLGGGYGRVPVLREVSLNVAAGTVVGLLGANGAGKSTLLRMIAGVLRPAAGAVRLDGRRIDGLRADRLARLGIALVPERRELFAGMTVAENLEMGAFARRDRGGVAADRERVLAYFPTLRERLGQRAGTLSGGEQQMLAIGRALMARPRLLLLDEPSLGLSPRLVEEIFRVLAEVHRDGATILLAEQNVWLTLGLAATCYLLEVGRIAASGASGELARDERIVQIYLGTDATGTRVPRAGDPANEAR
jgi:branched-chain amino acid transport system ATP-binding protein